MSSRLWYPQLDAYDTVRRMLGLLVDWPNDALTTERLYISDFYLANPTLLHKTNMPAEVRQEFRALHIERPEKAFLSYPSPQMLFAKMEPVQKESLRTLIGKGFVGLEALRVGRIERGASFVEIGDALAFTGHERKLIGFLSTHFSRVGAGIPGDLRSATGLRRPGA